MQILNKSIRIIDNVNNQVYSRDTPASFDEYLNELISQINTNNSIRDYKTRSMNTEVISCVLEILNNRDDVNHVTEKVNVIANRLLSKEIDAQQQVQRLNINVQKGSLIQALLRDEVNDNFVYLLAKVEHSNFVDDSDFSFKTGFSKDGKTIWKSCLFDIATPQEQEYHARLYSNTVAKYWNDDFLELDEMHDDESNTVKAFKAIETTLNRNIKSSAPRDYTIIRNAIISYFKSNDQIDYLDMVETVIGQYRPTDLSQEKLESLELKLKELPEKKNFDFQFSPVSKAINAKIKKVYQISSGIQLRILDYIDNFENTITAFREDDGARYIKIKTDNDLVYKQFAQRER